MYTLQPIPKIALIFVAISLPMLHTTTKMWTVFIYTFLQHVMIAMTSLELNSKLCNNNRDALKGLSLQYCASFDHCLQTNSNDGEGTVSQ